MHGGEFAAHRLRRVAGQRPAFDAEVDAAIGAQVGPHHRQIHAAQQGRIQTAQAAPLFLRPFRVAD